MKETWITTGSQGRALALHGCARGGALAVLILAPVNSSHGVVSSLCVVIHGIVAYLFADVRFVLLRFQ